ncbi:hypothetical protein, partial [Burkholderia ubonensis]|uniref:hypothetical protein n=2 Tax=Burkholderiaceae TaxID=119060 RepID=UPI001E45E1B6
KRAAAGGAARAVPDEAARCAAKKRRVALSGGGPDLCQRVNESRTFWRVIMSALVGGALGEMTKDTMEGIAFSKAATKLQQMQEMTKAENDVKKQATKMVSDASKPAQ